ncbi:MAG TPA: hypothetical protein VLA05_00345, partial [Coriobacteriia bacterium]|nr:hypothetical protein [Coriobacteriia bacterium]
MGPDAMANADVPTTGRSSRRFSPTTGIGRWAAGLGIATALWGLVFPFAGMIVRRMVGPDGRFPIPVGL